MSERITVTWLQVELIIIFFCIISCHLSCTNNDNETECPYPEIFNDRTEEVNEEEIKELLFHVNGNLSTQLKRIGLGEISADVLINLEDEKQELIRNRISYDSGFVKRWNLMRADICGMISIYSSVEDIDPVNRSKLQEQIVSRVLSFYDELNQNQIYTDPKGTNKGLSKKEHIKKIEADKDKSYTIILPIQLPSETQGYKNVFVNGLEASISPNSTRFNPRLELEVQIGETLEIIVLSNNSDTCVHQIRIPENLLDDLKGRLIVNCK